MKLQEVKEDLGHGVSFEMVLIPAGKFVMDRPHRKRTIKLMNCRTK